MATKRTAKRRKRKAPKRWVCETTRGGKRGCGGGARVVHLKIHVAGATPRKRKRKTAKKTARKATRKRAKR